MGVATGESIQRSGSAPISAAAAAAVESARAAAVIAVRARAAAGGARVATERVLWGTRREEAARAVAARLDAAHRALLAELAASVGPMLRAEEAAAVEAGAQRTLLEARPRARWGRGGGL